MVFSVICLISGAGCLDLISCLLTDKSEWYYSVWLLDHFTWQLWVGFMLYYNLYWTDWDTFSVTHCDKPAVFNLSNQLTITEMCTLKPEVVLYCYLSGTVKWSKWIASSLQ